MREQLLAVVEGTIPGAGTAADIVEEGTLAGTVEAADNLVG